MSHFIKILLCGAVLIASACDLSTAGNTATEPVNSAKGGGGNGPPWERAAQYGGGIRR